MSDNRDLDSLTFGEDSGRPGQGNNETQVIPTCQDPQTIVLAPLITINVNFVDHSVEVIQNEEPLANAQVPLSVNQLTLEVRPMCSIPLPGDHPEGKG